MASNDPVNDYEKEKGLRLESFFSSAVYVIPSKELAKLFVAMGSRGCEQCMWASPTAEYQCDMLSKLGKTCGTLLMMVNHERKSLGYWTLREEIPIGIQADLYHFCRIPNPTADEGFPMQLVCYAQGRDEDLPDYDNMENVVL